MTFRNRSFAWVTMPIGATILLAGVGFAIAGDLNPPAGPVTGTMKTLVEVEPRIAINATNTPGTATALFSITQPGSYYLTGNVTGMAGKNGIEITVAPIGPSVTIDLMGYELTGVAGSLDGILVTAAATQNLAVRNGTVRAWGGDGVDVFNASNSLLEDLRVRGNGGNGLRAGAANTVRGCKAVSNVGDGISASFGSTVTGCTASFSTGDGIEVNGDCRVTDNTCDDNGSVGDGAGIHATGDDNRIEGNNVTDNDRGMDIDAAGNLIIRNSASGNTTNYDIVAGNFTGTIVATEAAMNAAANANVNIAF